MKYRPLLTLALPLLLAASSAPATQIFINEIHYDNVGTDTGEFVEIAGPAGTDLTGWSLVLYNGTSSQRWPYDTISLTGTLTAQSNGFGFLVLGLQTNGIQNGDPDGLALMNGSTVIQFLSYEGAFEAASGPAASMTSTDIGVVESSSTPAGHSLQLTGTGSRYGDFTWTDPSLASPGAVNRGQSFTVPDHGTTFSLMALGLLSLPLTRKLRPS